MQKTRRRHRHSRQRDDHGRRHSNPIWNTYADPQRQQPDRLVGRDELSSAAVRCYSYFELLGNNQTLAGISDVYGRGIIENAEQESGVDNTGTLTINNTADCAYAGYIRNGDLAANGASTGLLALVKSGPGTLTLTGSNCGDLHRRADGQRRHARLQRRQRVAGHAAGVSDRSDRSDLAGGDHALSVHDQRRHA